MRWGVGRLARVWVLDVVVVVSFWLGEVFRGDAL